MKRIRLGFALLAGLMAGTAALPAVEIAEERLIGLDLRSLPRTVPGLELEGRATRAIKVTLADANGQLHPAAHPAVAVIRDSGWSPDDPARDAAGSFEVLLGAARVVRERPLAGLVSVGNHFGALQPGTEEALRRAVRMGLPVVRTARNGEVQAAPDDLLISAGRMPEAEARRVLSYCLVNYGALPPAANPDRPTAAETTALRARIRLYQQAFNVANAPLLASFASEQAAMAGLQ